MTKGFVFTTDILIGLTLLAILSISFFYFHFRLESSLPEKKYEQLVYLSNDLIDTLSHLTVKDVQDKPTISQLMREGVLKQEDLDKSILDLIASFWYSGNRSISENISGEILQGLDFCANITLDTETIYSSCNGTATEISVASRIETGYEVGRPTYGYISRAYLTSIKGKNTSSYAYFGGYVGDGNITKFLTLPSNFEISEVHMELNGGNNFNLYINGNFSGNYIPSRINMTADEWVVCNSTFNPSYCSFFVQGNNTIQINFTSPEDNYVGGGYVRVKYSTTEMAPSFAEMSNRSLYRFPGLQGIINLYDSFYIPGTLKSMALYLHLKNNYTTFLNIGNVTIYESNDTDEQEVFIPNSELSIKLDYDFLSNKTIPLRLGTEAFETVDVGVSMGDAMLVTDVSGSMEWCSNEPFGRDPHTSWHWKTWYEDRYLLGSWRWVPNSPCDNNAKRNIEIAREANTLFVDTLLNSSGNRVGLVDYTGSYWVYNYNRRRWFIKFPDHLAGVKILTDNKPILQDHIDKMETWWGTCTCCGINKAVKTIEQHSDPSRVKSLVVMSDGDANIECSEQGTGDPKQDAILAGQQACAKNITVYTVGYGEGVDENTLKQIACNESLYYSSTDVNQLVEIYREIAQEIAKASYRAQTINITGNISANNILYPDSYIEFNYTPIIIPYEYGEISLVRQTDKLKNMIGFNSTDSHVEGGYFIPVEVKITDAKATSYSSQYWTDRVFTKIDEWESVYKLKDYGDDYTLLGDPYIVQIPVDKIEEGRTNFIRIGTGLSPINTTGGSPDDRVIYSMRIKGSVGYGNVFDSYDLAVDDARERLINATKDYVNAEEDDIQVDSKTVRGIRWLWGPSLLKVIMWEKPRELTFTFITSTGFTTSTTTTSLTTTSPGTTTVQTTTTPQTITSTTTLFTTTTTSTTVPTTTTTTSTTTTTRTTTTSTTTTTLSCSDYTTCSECTQNGCVARECWWFGYYFNGCYPVGECPRGFLCWCRSSSGECRT